jgi:hypothetical protein
MTASCSPLHDFAALSAEMGQCNCIRKSRVDFASKWEGDRDLETNLACMQAAPGPLAPRHLTLPRELPERALNVERCSAEPQGPPSHS